MDALNRRIAERLAAAGSPRTEPGPLADLARELLKWNRTVRLTALPDEEAILEALVLDALDIAQEIPAGSTVADVGSGAGFPGLVIAWAIPSVRVTSIEARQKKVIFQEHAARYLGLANYRAFAIRITPQSVKEGLFGKPGSFSRLTAQALGTPAFILNLAGDLLGPDGRALFIRGPAFEASERAELAASAPEWEIESVVRLEPRRHRENAVRVVCRRAAR